MEMKVKGIIYVFSLFLLVPGLNVSAGGMEDLSTLRKKAKERSENHEKEISDAMSVREEKYKTPNGDATSEVKVLSKGKKMRIERLIRVMDQNDQDGNAEGIMNIILFDGQKAWEFTSLLGKEKGKREISNKEWEQRQRLKTWWKWLPDESKIVGRETVAGQDCYIVEVKAEKQVPYNKIWISRRNLRMVKGIKKDGKRTKLITYSDFRTLIKDLEFPFRSEMYVNGKLQSTAIIKSFEINKGLSAEIFDPEKIKVKGLDFEEALDEVFSKVISHGTWSPSIPKQEIPSDVREKIEGLYSERARHRMKAAYALGEMGERAVPSIPFLIAMMDDDTPVIMGDLYQKTPGRAASSALSQMGRPALEPLISILKEGNNKIRLESLMALQNLYRRIKDSRIIDAVIAALNEGDLKVKKRTIIILKDIKNPRTIEALSAAMHDKDMEVRKIIVHALTSIKDSRTIEPLIAALKDKDKEIRKIAAEGLSLKKVPIAMDPLINASKDQDASVRRSAILALDSHKNIPRVREIFIDALKDHDVGVRRSALSVIARDPGKWALEPLIFALQDKDPKIREHSTLGLLYLGDGHAVRPLIKALKDPNKGVRKGAAGALGRIYTKTKDPRIVDPLIEATQDVEPEVRENAVGALKIKSPRVIETLNMALKDKAPGVREASARSLKSIKDEQSVEHLIPLLKDENMEVRIEAIGALRGMKDERVIEPLFAIVMDKSDRNTHALKMKHPFRRIEDDRELAIKVLGEKDDPRAIIPLTALLKDDAENPKYRYKAAEALGRINDPRIIDTLIQTLDDEDKIVRQYAAEALARRKDDRVLPTLLDGLNDKNVFVRRKAASSLCHFKDDRLVEPLIKALDDKDGYVREGAVRALGRIGDPRAVEPLINVLKKKGMAATWARAELQGITKVNFRHDVNKWKAWWNKNKEICIKFSRIETQMKEKEAPKLVEYLINALNDQDPYIRKRAARALADSKDSRVLSCLMNALNDPNPGVRASAALALGKKGENGAVGSLNRSLSDEDKEVRSAVAYALKKLKDKRSVEPLIAALNDQSKRVKVDVIWALMDIGDSRSIKPLIKTLRDQDANIRIVALRALKKITGESLSGDPEAWLKWWNETKK